MNTRYLLIGILALAVAGAVLLVPNSDTNTVTGNVALDDVEADVYLSPTCGCCGAHAEYMEVQGMDVDVTQRQDPRVDKHPDLPHDLYSCHTTYIGDYFVEGHVPAEVIDTLLEEQPDLEGIALPGMPRGSPGMGGAKMTDWTIYGITPDGDVIEWMEY